MMLLLGAVLVFLVGVDVSHSTPYFTPSNPSNQNQLDHPAQSPLNYNPLTIKTMLQKNHLNNEDLDPQTQKNLRILNFLEDELNKIFSCYIRLSCPRTRSREVVAECEEIRTWPLYHQVMKMAGIKRYPYSNFAPKQQSTPPPPPPTTVTTYDGAEGDHRDRDLEENGIEDDQQEEQVTTQRSRGWRRVRRGRDHRVLE